MNLDATEGMLHQMRVHFLKDKVATSKHAALIHQETEYGVDRIYELLLVLVVFIV